MTGRPGLRDPDLDVNELAAPSPPCALRVEHRGRDPLQLGVALHAGPRSWAALVVDLERGGHDREQRSVEPIAQASKLEPPRGGVVSSWALRWVARSRARWRRARRGPRSFRGRSRAARRRRVRGRWGARAGGGCRGAWAGPSRPVDEAMTDNAPLSVIDPRAPAEGPRGPGCRLPAASRGPKSSGRREV